jgi:hypothetical protein
MQLHPQRGHKPSPLNLSSNPSLYFYEHRADDSWPEVP